jgi:predicted flap endonuclease-1-like 5' DNA nuclease
MENAAMTFIETNWLLLLIVAALAIAIAWYIFHAARRTRVTGDRRDVLDEGVAPAARNQALIDAPKATEAIPVPPAAPAGLAGAGEVVSAVVESRQLAAAQDGDDLTRIKGVGPKLAAVLGELGVDSFAQIAAWTESEIDRIDGQLGRFEGRIRRDSWVEQARLLAAGDEGAFAARFGSIS